MSWLEIWGTYWLIVSILGLFYLNRIFAKYSKRTKFQDKQQRYVGHVRSDFGKWPQKRMYFGAVAYLPFKFLVTILFLLNSVFFLCITQMFSSNLRAKILRMFRSFQLFMIGMTIRIKQLQPIKKVKTPIIIANHTCWFDIVYLVLGCWPCSFVSKAEIQKVPIVSNITTYLKCVFVNRQKASGRQDTISKIKQRIDYFYELKNEQRQDIQEAYPLIIFPEGTTSNGKYLIKFKSGAFDNLSPITVMCLNYSCDDFDMGMDQINQAQHTILMLCLRPNLQVKQFEIKPLENENSLDYMNRCKEQMGKTLNYPLSEAGYRQKNELLEMFGKKKSQ